MSTRTRWLVGAAVCVVAVIAGATVVRMTEQKAPMLVEVPCDPDQFVHKSEADTAVCYDGEANRGSDSAGGVHADVQLVLGQERGEPPGPGGGLFCGPEIPDIPEDQEFAAGIRPLPD